MSFFWVLQPPSPEVKEVVEEEEKVPSGPRQWIGLGSEREIEEESTKETRNKVGSYVISFLKTVLTLFYLRSLFVARPTTVPLCSNLPFFFLFCLRSATVHILQRAQEIWPAGAFFRPQRCRCPGRPRRLRFLSGQQLQHWAGAAGPHHPGYSRAEEQQRSDTMVRRTLIQLITGI